MQPRKKLQFTWIFHVLFFLLHIASLKFSPYPLDLYMNMTSMFRQALPVTSKSITVQIPSKQIPMLTKVNFLAFISHMTQIYGSLHRSPWLLGVGNPPEQNHTLRNIPTPLLLIRLILTVVVVVVAEVVDGWGRMPSHSKSCLRVSPIRMYLTSWR